MINEFSQIINWVCLHREEFGHPLIAPLKRYNSEPDAGQPEQNWNNGKIKGYDLGVST